MARPGRSLLGVEAKRLAELVARHGGGLVLYARQWCATPEDAAQEAFVKLAVLAREPDDPAAWLYRATRNAAISAGRGERRRRHHESTAARPDWFVPSPEGPDPAEVARALELLPADLREPLVAHLWGGLTFAAIGPLMGVSASTAHRRYEEALAILRQTLRLP
jgi:RNA polymerase sigma-70 factor (ECF subfamily)